MSDWRNRLTAVAESWVGTPYRPEGATIKGHGASCERLILAVLQDAGCPIALDLPAHVPARPDHDPGVRGWFAARPRQFLEITPDCALPGDLIGITFGRYIRHLGLCLGGPRFVHVLASTGTVIHSLNDPSWGKRLAGAWTIML